MSEIIIIGGGPAGLINSILLSRKGFNVLLAEKGNYPSHKVCGEYVSNEVSGFLMSEGIHPGNEIALPSINRVRITSPGGKSVSTDLVPGGFGISRYKLDDFLYHKALESGVEVRTGTKVTEINFSGDKYQVKLDSGDILQPKLVIGSFGKRSTLDRDMDRPFLKERSPYLGVKYHIRYEHPENLISLHNFRNGYCGMSKIEDGISCLCYLVSRDEFKKAGSIPSMEKNLLSKNRNLDKIFSEAKFLWDKPKVINEISFKRKAAVVQGVLMCGDSAGMITPLCGNGMAMAIHSAKLLSDIITKNYSGDRFHLEQIFREYSHLWSDHFGPRLAFGRSLQKLFGKPGLTDISLATLRFFPGVVKSLVTLTHGSPIKNEN